MLLRWALGKAGNMATQQLSQMRRSYKAVWNVLLEENLPTKNPVHLFEKWFLEAKDSGTIYETNAVAVASATRDGIPSVRMVLLKQYDERGFVFFTNYDSRKGRELVLEEEHAALKSKFSDSSIPVNCPDNWGGLILIPERFEFWQGQTTRLHDRLVFRKPSSERETELAKFGWYLERLAP
ncbi:pyridoxine-5'-phosphate oxidase-like [Tropilaelaps mercedesae]|uniref:pyridoxal 5'-phosphate synthase n=1 Tax=Tropilaelaps mercedesae TaxID=418985 RepID=A0A1V9XQE5_9ACAR|nr:pyridoxine-5'-phosphate oxidase-like [Tropilaelaps mercedesae]